MSNWREECEMVFDTEGRYLAEDENGDLLVPVPRLRGTAWQAPLNLWNPTHWPPYLRSRRGRKLVMVTA